MKREDNLQNAYIKKLESEINEQAELIKRQQREIDGLYERIDYLKRQEQRHTNTQHIKLLKLQ